MPSTVQELARATDIEVEGPLKWGDKIPCKQTGIYFVSLSPRVDTNEGFCLSNAPINLEIIAAWLHNIDTVRLDSWRPTKEELALRLASFWLPDETILYIGKAGTSLRTRVGQYYRTKLGQPRPHHGGYWIKTLANLKELNLYWAASDMPEFTEGQLLNMFVQNVSSESKKGLRDKNRPFPFANLEYPQGTRKKHGITGATLPK